MDSGGDWMESQRSESVTKFSRFCSATSIEDLNSAVSQFTASHFAVCKHAAISFNIKNVRFQISYS